MAASATFALKAGVWFRRGRLFIVSPDSRGTACPLSGRNSTYRPVQILEAGSLARRSRPSRTLYADANKILCVTPADHPHGTKADWPSRGESRTAVRPKVAS